jgi:hypothetical protein
MSRKNGAKTTILFLSLVMLLVGCITDNGNDNGSNNVDNGQNGDPTDNGEKFVVTQEVYTQTFDEIGDLITRLNKIIATTNYADWKKHLSQSYVKQFSDPAVLKEYSETPILKENKIVLKSLYDYFMWVVVPSRSNVRLDEIVFLDENRVIAYMIIENKKTILYQLEKIDGKWKISTW